MIDEATPRVPASASRRKVLRALTGSAVAAAANARCAKVMAQEAGAPRATEDAAGPIATAADPGDVRCDNAYGPSIFTPVFYGIRDYGPATGLDTEVRVYFPSSDATSPPQSPILRNCGTFPLILFLHGHCGAQPDHHTAWEYIPYMLSRSGYVVAIPRLPRIEAGSIPVNASGDSDWPVVQQVLHWMRHAWEYRALLAPTLGVVGHSYGGLLGAIVVYNEPEAPYVSLSGEWGEVARADVSPVLFGSLGPALFMWGTGDDRLAQPEGNEVEFWDLTNVPKHQLAFTGAGHWDYLPAGAIPCAVFPGPCPLVERLAGDFTTTFMTRYVPPHTEGATLGTIPDSLIPPNVTPTDYDPYYLSAFMLGLTGLPQEASCGATHSWRLAGGISEEDKLSAVRTR